VITSNSDFILPEGLATKLNSLSKLSIELKKQLLYSDDSISLTKGSILFSEDEPALYFYFVISGGIKLTKDSKESNTLLDIIGPGELFGAPLMLNSNQLSLYPVTAKTLGPTEVIKYSRNDIEAIWKKSPLLMEFMTTSILKRIQRLQNDRCIQRLTLEQKVAYFMTEKWISSVSLKITRQDIADSIGASQEAVIRLLSAWSKAGFVQHTNNEISLTDVDALRALWTSG